MSHLAEFLCVSADHRAHAHPSGELLSVHEGKIAICLAGAVSDHVWHATPGIHFDERFEARTNTRRLADRDHQFSFPPRYDPEAPHPH